MWSSSIKMSLTFKNDFDDVQNVMPNTAVVMMRRCDDVVVMITFLLPSVSLIFADITAVKGR
jgi:hypothetical protein